MASFPSKAGSSDALEWHGINVHGVTDLEHQAVLRVLDEGSMRAGLTEFLLEYPLSSVEFMQSSPALMGIYYREDAKIVLNIYEPPYGSAFSAGKLYCVSDAAADALESVQRTFVHELGHHLHSCAGPEAERLIEAHLAGSRLGDEDFHYPRAITRYAGLSEREYFAETFAAYVYCKRALRRHDRAGYNMIGAILTLMGVTP